MISRGFSKRFNAIFELARLKASPKIKQNFVKLRHCQLSSLHYELASFKSGIALRLSAPKEVFFLFTQLYLLLFPLISRLIPEILKQSQEEKNVHQLKPKVLTDYGVM